jgi:hypothetical protein
MFGWPVPLRPDSHIGMPGIDAEAGHSPFEAQMHRPIRAGEFNRDVRNLNEQYCRVVTSSHKLVH